MPTEDSANVRPRGRGEEREWNIISWKEKLLREKTKKRKEGEDKIELPKEEERKKRGKRSSTTTKSLYVSLLQNT